LTADYDGPVLVVNTAALENAHGPMVGAQNLLYGVRSLACPIAYVDDGHRSPGLLSVYPQGDQVATFTDLQKACPRAHFFLLGTTAGTDAQNTADGLYLINTDPQQKGVPAGFHGVISDDFTSGLQNKILDDLRRRLSPYPSGPAVAIPGNVPASPAPTLERQGAMVDENLVQPLAGLPSRIEGFFEQRRQDVTGLAHQVLQSPVDPLSPAAAARLAGALMAGHSLDPAARSQALLRILRSGGDVPGRCDAILSRLPQMNPLLSELEPADQATWKADRQRMQPVRGEWQGFQTYLDELTGTREIEGSHMHALIDGPEVFSERLAAIAQARKYINVGTFIFNSDETGRNFAQALTQAADRGVKVRVYYDTVGSARTYGQPTDESMFDQLRQHGVEVVEHRPGPLADHLCHRKILTMDCGDSQLAFTGGMNIGNEYSVRWHDVDCKITGPAAAALNRMFIEDYRADQGVIPAAEEAAMMAPGPAAAGGGALRVIGHRGDQDQDLKYVYLRAIDTAKKSIQIANPYVSDPDIIQHLIDASKAGVKVELFFPHTVDDVLLQHIARASYDRMAAAGIQLYEYDGKPMAHEKVAVFDGQVSTIGSSNFDQRSLYNNDEDNVWSHDVATAHDIQTRLFDHDRPLSIDYDHWKPGAFEFLLDKAASLASPWA
jgi:cardiolipin synthase